MRVAYYKGCLASLSAKELDSATQALAPKVGLELVELESVTCCGAGDIHEAEPDYYLHLNARILAYAAATPTSCERWRIGILKSRPVSALSFDCHASSDR